MAVNFPILKAIGKKPEKDQGFNGIWNRDLHDTGAILYQLSYEVTHWERGKLIKLISSREEWIDVTYVYEITHI